MTPTYLEDPGEVDLKKGKKGESACSPSLPKSHCCEGVRGNSAKPGECAEGLGPSLEAEHSLICTGGHNIGDILEAAREAPGLH